MDTQSARILVVDDEPDILELVVARLEMAGHHAIQASTGEEGLRAFFEHRPELALLDIDMPGMDGIELCGRIREVSNIPVLFLTALGSENEKVRGLAAGADDYVVKPFGRDELMARVSAALRRASLPSLSKAPDAYSDPVLTIDYTAHRVTARGKELRLSPLEFKMLAALVANAGQVLSQERLIDLVWGADSLETAPESVRLYVSYVRGKIEENPRKPRLIQTVREFGYRYVAPERGVVERVA
ncbi:MAG: response regulator transcription factor [Chloroflexi bacterium]|nr:response regulator transcription factor [Chloroflexota bacterium]